MSTRLQIVMDKAELDEIQAAGDRARLTVSAWVRQELRQARSRRGPETPATVQEFGATRGTGWPRGSDPAGATAPRGGSIMRDAGPSYGMGRPTPHDSTSGFLQCWRVRALLEDELGFLLASTRRDDGSVEVEWHWSPLVPNAPPRSGTLRIAAEGLAALADALDTPLGAADLLRPIRDLVRRALEEAVRGNELKATLVRLPNFEEVSPIDLLGLTTSAQGRALLEHVAERTAHERVRKIVEVLRSVEVETDDSDDE